MKREERMECPSVEKKLRPSGRKAGKKSLECANVASVNQWESFVVASVEKKGRSVWNGKVIEVESMKGMNVAKKKGSVRIGKVKEVQSME